MKYFMVLAAAILLCAAPASAQLSPSPQAQQPKANNVPQQLYKCSARSYSHDFFTSGFHKTKAAAQKEALTLCMKGKPPTIKCSIISCS